MTEFQKMLDDHANRSAETWHAYHRKNLLQMIATSAGCLALIVAVHLYFTG